MNGREELWSLIRTRRSVRRFRPEQVPRDLVLQLIELASWAPSAGDRQEWYFTVVTSQTVKERMAEAVRQRWNDIVEANRGLGFIDEVACYAAQFDMFQAAPVVIVVAARRVDSVQKHMLGDDAAVTVGSSASAAMAAQNLMLSAHALGLGSCCMTGALAARVQMSQIIGLGKREDVICLIALGWPAEAPPAPPRKPAAEIARFIE